MKSRRISLIVVRSSTPSNAGTENTVFLPKCADVDDIVDFVYPTIESMMTRARVSECVRATNATRCANNFLEPGLKFVFLEAHGSEDTSERI